MAINVQDSEITTRGTKRKVIFIHHNEGENNRILSKSIALRDISKEVGNDKMFKENYLYRQNYLIDYIKNVNDYIGY